MTTLDLVQANVNSGTKTIEEAIVEAITEARQTCEINGDNSAGCAVAWDIVEELQAEKSHKKQAKQQKNSLENYCATHPEAVECLIYDV
ncbi:Calvin cycle protein CP12 [Nostocaceae cyanobacterium CENA369]|uniref:Calvin cycle protein CP12 n=1 Tax=Dendronalium phyllosphericum CENA369 TaxID=1725256 RepID=A0A8J7I4W3_9NOST|nr:Calvin cycle protein CP12 [Dendronalium phyllosphericum]MBH8574765.1 Calvin cycle protein CP12 [Dendronalium phyllosphericum CENA369]